MPLKQHRKALGCLATVVILPLLLLALHVPILRLLGGFLTIDDRIEKADAIFLLTGDPHTRPVKAAELFRTGIAPRVVVSRTEIGPAVAAGLQAGEAEAALRMLQRSGVPATSIVFLPTRVTSTWDEAVALRKYAPSLGIKRVVVVTSASHGRRARWLFRRALKGTALDVRFATVEDWRFDMDNWWVNEAGANTVANEYIRFVHNFFTRR